MSTHVVFRCDACPVSVVGEVEREHCVHLHLDRRMDAAGSMENVGETVHLCHACAIAFINLVTGNNGRSPGVVVPSVLLEWAKNRRKK